MAPIPPAPWLDLESLPNKALQDLASQNVEVRNNAILSLRVFVMKSKDETVRHAILDRLTGYISNHAPPMPTTKSFDYCFKRSPPGYPADVTAALAVIGKRNMGDINYVVNLSRTNLAYTNLQGLDFRSVIFDGALLCRTFLNDCKVGDASFDGTNLRFAIMTGVEGLTAVQLRKAFTIFKLRVPANLATDRFVRNLIRRDPELRGS